MTTGHPDYQFSHNAGGKMVQDWFDDLTKAFKLLFGTNAKQIKLHNHFKNYSGFFSPRFWENVDICLTLGQSANIKPLMLSVF